MFLLLAVAITAIVGVRYFILSDRYPIDASAAAVSKVTAKDSVPTDSAWLQALLDNQRPKRLLRMIAYDPATQQQLSIAQLKTLGRPDQPFTFVGDYDELRTYTVAEAVYKVGGNLDRGQHVSAIVFPAGDRPLYAASARGVLQVIATVEKSLDEKAADFVPADLSKRLPSPALAALADVSQSAGRWANYRQYYRDYAQAVAEIREAHCTVLNYIGSIDRDWHPLGYAQAIGREQPRTSKLYADLDGQQMPVPDFGARVFLVANAALADLSGQCLIDFDEPGKQRIPDLDFSVE
jgi:hypothetical protein